MDRKQILILLKIGNIDVSNKCIDSLTVDRNFSDVGDKFSIDIIDTPDTNVTYDLELYMASGYRNMSVKYGDISENELISFSGTIWDYTCTFVGNIKKLNITGIMNRYVNNKSGAGAYTYNIDWNSYFNKRQDETRTYGAINALNRNQLLTNNTITNTRLDSGSIVSSDTAFLSSAILDTEFKTSIEENAKTLTLKGPSGNTINLPIPDNFIQLSDSEIPDDIPAWFENPDENYTQFYRVMKDPNGEFWGQLFIANATYYDLANNSNLYNMISFYVADMFYIRAPESSNSDTYDKAGNSLRLKRVTWEVLEDTSALHFPTIMQTVSWSGAQSQYDFAIASQYFVSRDYLYNVGLESDSVDPYSRDLPVSQKYWANGANNKYGDFYNLRPKERGINDVPIAEYWRTEVFDKDNYIYYLVNENGKVVAFQQCRINGHKSKVFVAVQEADWNKINEYGRLPNGKYNEFPGYHTKVDGPPSAIRNSIAKNRDYVFVQESNIRNEYTGKIDVYQSYIRAFIIRNGSSRNLYVQANPDASKSVFGTAGIVNSGIGVDISTIVKRLCILEGWDYEDRFITQTELVPNADSFIMQNQTAMDFILNNLVPKAITPLGKYYSYQDGKWGWHIINKPMGGFYPFFDENGKFHFQPLVKENISKLDIGNLGYNIPNSPMISFQINTKGTAFYINRIVDYSPMSLVTGEQVSEVEVASDSIVNSIEKTKGHNDTFDSWLGLTYEDVEKVTSEDNSGTENYDKALSLAQNALVTSPGALLVGTSAYNSTDVITRVKEAEDKITKSVIKATLNMWGNTKVAPARNIRVTNMLKGGVYNSDIPQKHPSSGDYLILNMQDKISSSGYIQSLNLIRYTEDVEEGINAAKIDYTQGAKYVVKETGLGIESTD